MIKIMKYGEISDAEIFSRVVPEVDVEAIVCSILSDVRCQGDEALFRYCRKFDKADLSCLEVSCEELNDALSSVQPEFLSILQEAAENIEG